MRIRKEYRREIREINTGEIERNKKGIRDENKEGIQGRMGKMNQGRERGKVITQPKVRQCRNDRAAQQTERVSERLCDAPSPMRPGTTRRSAARTAARSAAGPPLPGSHRATSPTRPVGYRPPDGGAPGRSGPEVATRRRPAGRLRAACLRHRGACTAASSRARRGPSAQPR
jgi:hypothetical protein